jgi:hypothetical protein
MSTVRISQQPEAGRVVQFVKGAIRCIGLASGLAVALWPFALAAQEVPSGPGSPDSDRMVRAVQTYDWASSIAQHTAFGAAEWTKAAELFTESAKLLPVDDPRWFVASVSAAQIYHSLGEKRKAVGILVTTGERAHEVGQIVNAAEAFGLAAGIYSEMGRAAEALDFAGRSQLLASSPHITMSERTEILRKFSWQPEGAIQTVGR